MLKHDRLDRISFKAKQEFKNIYSVKACISAANLVSFSDIVSVRFLSESANVPLWNEGSFSNDGDKINQLK